MHTIARATLALAATAIISILVILLLDLSAEGDLSARKQFNGKDDRSIFASIGSPGKGLVLPEKMQLSPSRATSQSDAWLDSESSGVELRLVQDVFFGDANYWRLDNMEGWVELDLFNSAWEHVDKLRIELEGSVTPIYHWSKDIYAYQISRGYLVLMEGGSPMEFAIAQQGMIQVVESNILRVSIALPGIYAWSATHNRPLNEVSIIGSKSGNTRRGPELQPLPSARELIRTPISSEQTLTFSSLLISAPGHAWALVDSVPLKEREVRVVPLVSSGSVLLRLTSLRRDAVAGKRPRVHVQLTPRPTQADTVSNLLTTQSLSTSLSDALLATHEVLQWNGIAPGNYTISIRSELAAHTWMGHIEVESGRDTLVDDGLLGFLSTPIRYIHLSFQDIQNAEDFLGVDVACKDGSGSSIIRPFRPTNKVGDAAINPDFPREQWIALSPQDFAITLGDNDALLAPKTLRLLPWGVQVPTRLGVCVPDDNLIIAVERIKPRTIQVMLDDTPCQLASVRVGQWTEKGRYPAEVTCFGKPVPALAVTGSQFEFGLSDNYRVEVHLVLSQDGREWVCSMNSAELNEGILRLYSKDLAPDYLYFAFISQSKYNNVEDYLIHGVRFIGHDGLPLRSRLPTRVQLKTAELGNSAKAYSSVWKVEVPDSARDLTIPRGLNLETSARLDVLDVLAKGRHREPSDPFIVWCGKE